MDSVPPISLAALQPATCSDNETTLKWARKNSQNLSSLAELAVRPSSGRSSRTRWNATMTILEPKSRAKIPANPATRPIAPLICFAIGVFNCYADLPIFKETLVNHPVRPWFLRRALPARGSCLQRSSWLSRSATGRTLLERLVMHNARIGDMKHCAACDVCIIGAYSGRSSPHQFFTKTVPAYGGRYHARAGALPRISGRPERAHSLECGG
jgi:hypothetical protein